MKLIIHEPDAEDKKEELARLTAAFHAKAAIALINDLPCSRSEKLELVRRLRQTSSSFLS